MSIKPIKTYNQQMRVIRGKGIICGGSVDKKWLIRYGYFNLLNAYKKPFVSSTSATRMHTYYPSTTLEHLIRVKDFDNNLRYILFKVMNKIEEEMKTIFSHIFGHHTLLGSLVWTDTNSYDSNASEFDKMELISSIYSDISRNNKRNYMKHYCDIHKEIPVWVMAKVITFGVFEKFVNLSKDDLKIVFCDLYNIPHGSLSNPDYKLLKSIMHWFRIVRNSCAHNERIYNLESKNPLVISTYHSLLPAYYSIPVSGGRKKKIADLIIYIKHLLPANEYEEFVNQIESMCFDLRSQLPINNFNNVISEMGIQNMSFFSSIKINPNNIIYNNLR